MQYQRYAERGHIEVKPQTVEAKVVRIFDTGHSMHDRWARYWEELGVLRGIWECTNPLCQIYNDKEELRSPVPLPKACCNEEVIRPRKYGENDKLGIFKPEKCVCGHKNFAYHEIAIEDKELNFRGHVDLILDFSKFNGGKEFKKGNGVRVLFKDADLPKKPVLVDMKSINSFGFKGKLESGPPFDYVVQVNIYLHVLDLDLGVLYFENKDDSSTRLMHIEKNPDLWAVIKGQAMKMNQMVDELKLPPPRPVNPDGWECRNCEFQSICNSSGIWEDPKLDSKRLKFYGDFS